MSRATSEIEINNALRDRLPENSDVAAKIVDFKKVAKKGWDKVESFGKALSLSIAYASSCGGTATLTGTAPTVTLKGFIDERFKDVEGFNFASWMAYATPISALLLIVVWVWLMILFIGPRKTFTFKKDDDPHAETTRQVINEQYRSLPRIGYQEIVSASLFCICAILWISRNPGKHGWSVLFNKDKKYVKDAQVGMVISFILLCAPAKNPFRYVYRCIKPDSDKRSSDLPPDMGEEEQRFLLPWKYVQKRFPWGIVFILGGGFALSKCCEKSGLSNYIGTMLKSFAGMHNILLVLIVCIVAASVTEVTSNVTTASIFIPIVLDMSRDLKLHPFLITFPMTIATSFSFCLPVATPPNAIMFSGGRLRIIDMVKAGLPLNLVGILINLLGNFTIGNKMFNFDKYPDWAKSN